MANGRGEGRADSKRQPLLAPHTSQNSRFSLELFPSLPFTRAVLPENPKTRGFARVCGSRAERVGSIALPLPPSLAPSPLLASARCFHLPQDPAPPSKPNFSLTKPFLSGNLFRDRNSLSTITLARYNSGLLNAKYYSVLRSH